jgi:microcystin-dependent protein
MNKKMILFIFILIIILLNKKTKENFQQTSFNSRTIIMWYGNINEIPSGWVLCDGNNGTPDLRGRFILGVNPSTNKSSIYQTRELRTIGGEEKNTLTLSELPSHVHQSRGRCIKSCNSGSWPRFLVENSREDTPSTRSTGYSQPHNNMPPYYVLAYIMKT